MGRPTQRWPDVLSPGLGEEETYYYWTREDENRFARGQSYSPTCGLAGIHWRVAQR